MQAKNDDFKVKCSKLISENEYLLKINKELVDDNNNLTEALKKTYAEISQVFFFP
jgi:predicted nuclease with TOPRIM domain